MFGSIGGTLVSAKGSAVVHTAIGERFATMNTPYAVKTRCERYLVNLPDEPITASEATCRKCLDS